MSDFEQWLDRKRGEAFSTALEALVNSDNADEVIEECLQAESDVMRALNAHGLLP
jgi:hypothetical protein